MLCTIQRNISQYILYFCYVLPESHLLGFHWLLNFLNIAIVICNSESYCIRQKGIILMITRIQKCDTRFSGGSQLDTEKKIKCQTLIIIYYFTMAVAFHIYKTGTICLWLNMPLLNKDKPKSLNLFKPQLLLLAEMIRIYDMKTLHIWTKIFQ